MNENNYDDVIRAFAHTIMVYTNIHVQCWNASPEECKTLMTMKFPYLQGTEMHILLNKISELPFDTNKAGKQMKEYFNRLCNSQP